MDNPLDKLSLEERVGIQTLELKAMVAEWNSNTKEYLDMIQPKADPAVEAELTLHLEYIPCPLEISFATEDALAVDGFSEASRDYQLREYSFRSRLVVELYEHLWNYLDMLETAADNCLANEKNTDPRPERYAPKGVPQNIFSQLLDYKSRDAGNNIYQTKFARKMFDEIRQFENIGHPVVSETKTGLADMIIGIDHVDATPELLYEHPDCQRLTGQTQSN